MSEDDTLEIRLISREPLGMLALEGWLAWPETKAVVAALTAEGGEVRFVGGCVRDAVARRPVTDVDMATPLLPNQVEALLKKAGIKAVPTGIEHGTVTAVVDDRTFEITTLRRDASTDGRHASVEFTDDWVEDAQRRDFTINTLSCAPTGEVYDPFEGMRDLAHGIVRFVGRADDRVQEDYLRILRFFRFFAHYGRPPADRDALAACRAHAAKLKELSGERIQAEFLKILTAPQPAEICVLMRGHRVLEQILPEAGEVTRLRLVSWLARRGVVMEGTGPDAIRHLAALLDTDAEGASDVARRLRLSNAQTDRLVALARPETRPRPDDDRHAGERLLRRVGREVFRDLVLLGWAEEMAERRLTAAETAAWTDLLAFGLNWRGREFPLRGRDLLELGIEPGPRVGEVLSRVEQWWEDGRYEAGHEDCLARAREIIERKET